jgi:phosphopantothenoylcysteine decarboxylase
MSKAFLATSYRRPGAFHVLLLCTGSVASIKIPLIVQALLADPENRFEVQVAATNTSLTFFEPELVEDVSGGRSSVWSDEQEWGVRRALCSEVDRSLRRCDSIGKTKATQYYISR